MKKLALSLAITSILGLTACDDTSLEDVQTETAELQQAAKEEAAKVVEEQTVGAFVAFAPGDGVVSLPNDLLFAGTSDFTLETPAEADAKAAGQAVDFGNPEAALGALDGWGTQNAFSIAMNYSDGVSIDPASIATAQGDAVAIYEVVTFPNLNVAGCEDTSKALLACKGVDKLTFGVDYVATVGADGGIAVVPLKAFKPATSYIVALTKEIKDNAGNSIKSASDYDTFTTDVNLAPIVDPNAADEDLNATQISIRTLQNAFNSFENVLADDFGVNKDAIVYTQSFTTVSAGVPSVDPLQITKLLNAQEFAGYATSTDPVEQAKAAFPVINQGATVAQVLGLEPADGLAYLLYSSADIYGGYLEVPYYLERPDNAATTDVDEGTGDPLSGRWEAACDSGVVLAGATADQLAAGTPGANAELCSSTAVGLADLGLDTQRHLTKYNPVPKVKSMENIEVAMTLPNLTNANTLRGMNGLPAMTKPDAGWPVVMIQHGITSNKEDAMAMTGFLSMFGFATVAIDHPLHGSRGFVIGEGDSATVINASSNVEGNNPTHYLNLASLLTARDNLRQSVADKLKLRLALNGLVDATAAVDPQTLQIVDPTAIVRNIVDPSKVYFVGHSLGAITGTNFTAIANTPANTGDATTDAQINALYKVNAAFLANPGSSIGNFLVKSGSFGDLIQATVVAGLGNELTDLLMANLAPAAFGQIVAANPSCAAALDAELNVVDQNVALVCAFNALKATATPEVLAGIEAGVQQFAFAAQAVIEGGDPTNYSSLLAQTNTPVVVVEMVGDADIAGITLGTIPSDTVIPNSVENNPMAGTTGLANNLGLMQITDTTVESSGTVSGIIKYRFGSHSTMGNPLEMTPDGYPADLFSNLHQDLQQTMAYFFISEGKAVNINADLVAGCAVKGGNPGVCGE